MERLAGRKSTSGGTYVVDVYMSFIKLFSGLLSYYFKIKIFFATNDAIE
jgi:hypothetical protein